MYWAGIERRVTRFDAREPDERLSLFADAIRAHRERASQFLTLEADPATLGDARRTTSAETTDDATSASGADDTAASDTGESAEGDTADEAAELAVPPWVQFREDTFNLDCTDAELSRLKELVGEYPECRIDALEQPDEAEGTNVRITARSDAVRLAEFADRVFQRVYEAPDDYRAWVVDI